MEKTECHTLICAPWRVSPSLNLVSLAIIACELEVVIEKYGLSDKTIACVYDAGANLSTFHGSSLVG